MDLFDKEMEEESLVPKKIQLGTEVILSVVFERVWIICLIFHKLYDFEINRIRGKPDSFVCLRDNLQLNLCSALAPNVCGSWKESNEAFVSRLFLIKY